MISCALVFVPRGWQGTSAANGRAFSFHARVARNALHGMHPAARAIHGGMAQCHRLVAPRNSALALVAACRSFALVHETPHVCVHFRLLRWTKKTAPTTRRPGGAPKVPRAPSGIHPAEARTGTRKALSRRAPLVAPALLTMTPLVDCTSAAKAWTGAGAT